MKNVFKLIQSERCVQLTVIYGSSASNCLKCSKGKVEAGGWSVEGMQLMEVKWCVHGVALCPSLYQDLHAMLMSSDSRSATAELNDACGIPPASCNYNFFSLHMLTSACTAHGFLLLCRLEVIWKAAWRAQTPKRSPKLHLPLYKLILSTACNYICMYL